MQYSLNFRYLSPSSFAPDLLHLLTHIVLRLFEYLT
jgi:hypothetical protein